MTKFDDMNAEEGKNCLRSEPRSKGDTEKVCFGLLQVHRCFKIVGIFVILAAVLFLLNLILFIAEVSEETSTNKQSTLRSSV